MHVNNEYIIQTFVSNIREQCNAIKVASTPINVYYAGHSIKGATAQIDQMFSSKEYKSIVKHAIVIQKQFDQTSVVRKRVKKIELILLKLKNRTIKKN